MLQGKDQSADGDTLREPQDAPPQAEPTVLQSLILPEPGVCGVRDLYVRLTGPAGLSDLDAPIEFNTGGQAKFDTYFNLFNLGKWKKHCGLDDLRLVLRGRGRVAVTVCQDLPRASRESILDRVVDLDPDRPLALVLSALPTLGKGGVLSFHLTALGPAQLTDAAWCSAQAPLRSPELVLSITTFRREKAVRRSVERFREFIATSPQKDHIRLVVVDNGKSAGLEVCDHVVPVGNENFGGAGGFARGLLEAKAQGATHCLFMDDDAMVHMAVLERVRTFLAYATDPATAVVGALAKGADKSALWENGAVFDTRCYRQHGDLDLSNPHEVLRLEIGSMNLPEKFYGGWWFFAFPVEKVEHMPFPFFVRGDDVSFSLVHDFRMVTLPGVITFQDSDFDDKATPLTTYLDLRSHLAHHLALPVMDIGRKGMLRIMAWFFARNMSMCQYETLATINMAVEDVLQGPDFFVRNIDMSERRAQINGLMDVERWQPIEGPQPPLTPGLEEYRKWKTRFMLFTLNGHFLPFFKVFGKHHVIASGDRGKLSLIWGADRITYVDRANNKSYTVGHSKLRAARQALRMLANMWRFWRTYEPLKRDWVEGYDRLTTEEFWQEALKT